MGRGIISRNLNNKNGKKIMDDNKLIEIAHSIDTYLNAVILENELSVNALNGIIMARLTRLNQVTGNTDNYNRLLTEIASGELGQEDKVLQ